MAPSQGASTSSPFTPFGLLCQRHLVKYNLTSPLQYITPPALYQCYGSPWMPFFYLWDGVQGSACELLP